MDFIRAFAAFAVIALWVILTVGSLVTFSGPVPTSSRASAPAPAPLGETIVVMAPVDPS